MDSNAIETLGSIAFMVFGLGFFLFVMLVILRDDRETYNRRDYADHVRYGRKIEEAREFGFENSRLHAEAEELKKSAPQKPRYKK